MSNGFSNETMLSMILEKVEGIQREVSALNANGCAQRKNDLRDIEALKAWRETVTNKFIATLVGIISSLCVAIYSIYK